MPLDDQKDAMQSAVNKEPGSKAGTAVVAATITERELQALFREQRKRVNRILMRKRSIQHYPGDPVPRLITTLFILLLVIVIILSSSGGATFAYYQSQLPILNNIATHSLFQTTHIYDRNGKLLYDLYDRNALDRGRRTYVNFSDIPDNLVNATIAVEDHSFWSNSGVDYQGILRALISNLNGVREGGSTVTQELIKDQLFANTLNNRTPQLKAQEAVLALGLTQQYPKWKIMEMYLNTVFYGDSNYGVEAAAQDYFHLQPKCVKHVCQPAVAQLDLAQASLLAGLPQSPTFYMPFTNKPEALKRQADVLKNMVNLKQITPAQQAQAQKEMQKYTFKPSPTFEQAPHFVNYVINQVLIPLFGASNLLNGGYSIYTTLDLDLEKQVEQIEKKWIDGNAVDAYYYTNLKADHNLNNAATVVTDPKTGEILAMDGSVDYNSNDPRVTGNFNSATDAIRQPGSSFKPIVYATAFEKGWYPAMVVPDVPTTFPATPPYAPKNYDRNYHGATMTVRRGIANSYNIPAVNALEYAGVPDVMNMAGRLGLTHVEHYPTAKQGPAMALGAAGETLLNMTGAYATFANGGVRMPQTTILKILDNQGRTVYDLAHAGPRGQRVMRADIAYLMTSILSDTNARHEEFAPGNPLELDRPAAAKTGTTDDFVDNWTMGYTPHLAVGVWAGNSNNEQMINVIGITGAGPIWHDVITWADAHYHFPSDDFARPSDVVQGTVSVNTGLAIGNGETGRTDWMIDGTQPTIVGSNYYTTPTKPKKPGSTNPNNGNPNSGTTGGYPNGGGNPPVNGNPGG